MTKRRIISLDMDGCLFNENYIFAKERFFTVLDIVLTLYKKGKHILGASNGQWMRQQVIGNYLSQYEAHKAKGTVPRREVIEGLKDIAQCYLPARSDEDIERDVINENQALFAQLKSENAPYDGVTVIVGSNRQSKKIDDVNARVAGKGSAFPAIRAAATELNAELDTFLLADVYGELEDGTSFDRAVKKSSHHAKWKFDDTKLSILYTQIQRAASLHPGDEIDFDFYDDRTDILDSLKKVFTANPHLIPANVTLRLHQYKGGEVVDYQPIQGQGVCHQAYRQTLLDCTAYIENQLGRSIESYQKKYRKKLNYADRLPGFLQRLASLKTSLSDSVAKQLSILEMKRAALVESCGADSAPCQAMDTLCHSLKAARTEFEQSPGLQKDYQVMQASFTSAIDTAKQSDLGQHRGVAKNVLYNLGLFAAGLGAFYLIGLCIKNAIHFANGQSLGFFSANTDSVNKIEACEEAVSAITCRA